ncbi:MAG: hypothetical protein WC916_03250 [Candidatus Woesearchaeota archaeon]
MINTEIQELKRKVLETDISINNPGMQYIIELEITRWVKSYEEKKTRNISDCYGAPGEIPDIIAFQNVIYTPQEILAQVKARTEMGMSILRKIEENHEYIPKRFIKRVLDPRQAIVDSVPDNVCLDEIVITCACGEHNQSYRDLLNGIISTSPESAALTIGWSEGIQSLYKRAD